MPDFATTEHVFPTSNDLFGAGAAGDGVNMREGNLAANWLANMLQENYVISGFLLPVSSVDLDIVIPTGKAYIAGYFVDVTATTVTAAASSTNHVFLRLDLDGGNNVSAAVFEVNTTGTAPARSVKIGTLTTDADNITATAGERSIGPPFGRVIFRDVTSKLVDNIAGPVNVFGPLGPVIPAGLLGISGGIRIIHIGEIKTASSRTFRLRFKLAGVVMLTTGFITPPTTNSIMVFTCVLFAAATTDGQVAMGSFWIGTAGQLTGLMGTTFLGPLYGGHNNFTRNAEGTLVLNIDYEWSGASAGATAKALVTIAELLQPGLPVND